MIEELLNLSAGRIVDINDVRRARRTIPPTASASPQAIAENTDGVDAGRATSGASHSDASLAALDVNVDDPIDVSANGSGNEALASDDVSFDPSEAWSLTAYRLATSEPVTPALEGFVGSTFAYAQANGKETLGMLPQRQLLKRLGDKGLAPWATRQMTQMSLRGAPICPSEALVGTLLGTWDSGATEVTALARALESELPKDFSHVLIVPWLDTGGAERVALWHAQAIDAAGANCVVIATDGIVDRWASKLPQSARYICLQRILKQKNFGPLSGEMCADALALALSGRSFDVLHVVSSFVGTRMLLRPVDWKCDLVCYSLFGVGRDAHGLEAGYWFSAGDLLGVDRFLSDNSIIPDERARAFGLRREKITALAYPVEPTLRHLHVPLAIDKRVLWASRFDREKQPALVFEIARRMPEVTFYMFGRSVLGDCALPTPPANVVLGGPFDGWTSLPDAPFDCFLFTSLWEGLPNILLEAIGSGLPVVASNVGAVSEVIDDNRGWLVESSDGPEPYVSALTEVLADRSEAKRRARVGLERLQQTRTFARFRQSLEDISYIAR